MIEGESDSAKTIFPSNNFLCAGKSLGAVKKRFTYFLDCVTSCLPDKRNLSMSLVNKCGSVRNAIAEMYKIGTRPDFRFSRDSAQSDSAQSNSVTK